MKKVLLTIIFTVALLVGVTAAFSTGVLGDAGADLACGIREWGSVYDDQSY